MKNFRSAELRKWRAKFKVGDLVTWGNGSISHSVVEIRHHGVVVDASSVGFSRRYFVAFDGNMRHTVGSYRTQTRAEGTLRKASPQ